MSADALHHARILIVDDEANEIQLLREVLRLEGYTDIQSTTDAREVLHLFAEFQPDLLILDLMMHHWDGLQIMTQLAPLISKDDYFPIIVITGDSSRETRHQVLAHGAKDFLTKPFDPTEILLRVRNLLETRFLHNQIQQHNQQLEATVRERTTELMEANESLITKVHEQERVEAALRNSEIKFRSLMESATDAIVLTDHNNYVTGCNRSAQGLFGYSEKDMLGQPLVLLMPERYRGEHAAGFHHLQTAPGVHIIGRTLELYGMRKDGIEFPIEVAVSSWEVDEKRCFSNIIRDITERKRIEHDLRHNEMLLAEAQRLARLGSWEWNIVEDFLVWSDELYRIYGLQPHTFSPVLASFLDIVHPAEREFIHLVIERARRDQQPFEFDHRIVRPDGTTRTVHQRGMVVVDEMGQPIRMFGSTQDVTEARQSEIALQESKEQLELVLNAVPSAISWINADLRYVGINSYLASLLQLGPEQVIGREVGFLGANTPFTRFVEEFFATATRAAEREVELIIAGMPQTFWIMARKYRHNDAAVFVGTDITERKQAELNLQQTKDHLQLVLDTVPGGVSWVTSDLEYLAVNRYLADTFHLKQEDFIGKPIGFLNTDEGYTEFLQDFFAGTEETAFREIPVLVDGNWKTILMTVRKHNHGRSAVVIGIDITDRKKAEDALQEAHDGLEVRVQERTAELNSVVEALRESESRLLLALQAGGMGIWEWHINTGHIWWSQELEELNGLPRGTFPGTYQAFKDILHPEDRDAVLNILERALANEGDYQMELRIIRPDSSVRWQECIGRVFRDETGQAHRMLGVVRDITERKQAEANLWAAKEEAESANHAKSEFLSRMSHELRTPLNAILGFTQLLDMDERPPQERQNLDYIFKAGKHLLALIDEVLDISRIESGRISVSIEPVETTPAIQESIVLVRQKTQERKIRVYADSNCNVWALADKQRLHQVLLNLLSNAIKYNRADGEVRITCDEIDAPVNEAKMEAGRVKVGNQVRISVIDTGIGIPQALQARLFTPFDRLGAEQSSVEGIGIGLALSKRLIEVMGGRMGFESTEGEGSVFWIELPSVSGPLDNEVTNKELLSASSDARDSESLVPETTHTILYIEDNLSNLHLIESILNRHPKFRLIAAMQGNIGLELAKERLPDIIILDLHLPDLPGAEVLRRLRADSMTKHIPVIVLSADATPSRITELLESGAREYLTKPLQIRQFLQTLEDVLQYDTNPTSH